MLFFCVNRFQLMHDNYSFNPRKCNSASSLSGSIERDLSKVIIVFPTTNENADVFEQTLTGRFSCVNTCFAFDTKILLPNFNEKTKDDLNKDYVYKACYRLKLDNDKIWTTRTVISKIVKLDENNQYG